MFFLHISLKKSNFVAIKRTNNTITWDLYLKYSKEKLKTTQQE